MAWDNLAEDLQEMWAHYSALSMDAVHEAIYMRVLTVREGNEHRNERNRRVVSRIVRCAQCGIQFIPSGKGEWHAAFCREYCRKLYHNARLQAKRHELLEAKFKGKRCLWCNTLLWKPGTPLPSGKRKFCCNNCAKSHHKHNGRKHDGSEIDRAAAAPKSRQARRAESRAHENRSGGNGGAGEAAAHLPQAAPQVVAPLPLQAAGEGAHRDGAPEDLSDYERLERSILMELALRARTPRPPPEPEPEPELPDFPVEREEELMNKRVRCNETFGRLEEATRSGLMDRCRRQAASIKSLIQEIEELKIGNANLRAKVEALRQSKREQRTPARQVAPAPEPPRPLSSHPYPFFGKNSLTNPIKRKANG